MRLRVGPRNRMFFSLLTLLSFCWGVTTWLHWRASKLRLDQVKASVRALEQWKDTTQKEILHLRQVGVSSNAVFSVDTRPAVASAASSQSSLEFVRPLVLGSGRSSGWYWTDVRFADGTEERHYLRTNATPRQVRAYVHRLAQSSNEHSWIDRGAVGD